MNPDMSAGSHNGISMVAEGGYQVAILPADGKQLTLYPSLQIDRAYYWTFEAKADNPGDKIYTSLWGDRGAKTIPLTSEWQQYSSMGTPNPNYQYFYFWSVAAKGNVYLRNIKLYDAQDLDIVVEKEWR
ncbi:hypothetical protein [Limosilactobacillus oris]|uniref:hypothetical protein n=1 Tax=Limosilactobacillus oris TaxID=1632 RepID=UPI0018840F4C|nr:hypothetical protein [Limosilactobacillus oris]MBF0600877.1 hypothetical protein [Limosilactobacillus oris]